MNSMIPGVDEQIVSVNSGHEVGSILQTRRDQWQELAGFDRFDRGGLVKPAWWRGVSPESRPSRVVDAPPDRIPIRVRDQIVSGVKLNPVPVGVAKVKKERVAEPVPAGSPLDRPHQFQRSKNIARAQDAGLVAYPKSGVMDPRPQAGHERKVVDVLLAIEPGGPQLFRRAFRHRVLGTTEAKLLRKPVVRLLDVRNLAIEMVETHDVRTPVPVEPLEQSIPLGHRVEEFHRQAGRILYAEGPALAEFDIGFDAANGTMMCPVQLFEPRQIILRRNAKRDVADTGRFRFSQHKTVQVAFFHASKVYAILVTAGLDESKRVTVKCACPVEVRDPKLEVCCTCDVKGRLRAHGRMKDKVSHQKKKMSS